MAVSAMKESSNPPIAFLVVLSPLTSLRKNNGKRSGEVMSCRL
jgi:hypothetical protein